MIDRTLLMINRMEFLSGEEKLRLYAHCPDAKTLVRMSKTDLCSAIDRGSLRAAWNPEELWQAAEIDHDWIVRGGTILVNGTAAYPALLSAIDDPPLILFCRGDASILGKESLALVGTRMPSEVCRVAAWKLGQDCVAQGLVVVSGLAHGIDGAAHAGCVVAGGQSVAVLACGIDRVNPGIHRSLAQSIVAMGGCLVSEYGPGSEARKYRFPARNRIISGLCRAVVVVEAPVRSGALITAQFALDQGREVCVHADGCRGKTGAGCSELVFAGARPIRNIEEIESYGRGHDS